AADAQLPVVFWTMPTSISRLVFVLALFVTLQPLSAQRQVFRSGTELVEVDVVVLDSTGRIVRGLTADDFELYDEGDRQDVSTFSFVEVDPELIATGSAAMSEPALASSQANSAAAVYLIVLDHFFSRPQYVENMREAARDFVRDHMRAGDLAAVIHLGLSAQGVEFSGSKAQLLEAIDAVRGSAGYSGQSPTPPIG